MSKKHLRTETGTVRRTYKDTVFRKIFNNKENLLALYNALNGTHYNNPEDIEIITLDNALFLKMKNDIAFLVSTDQICLVEHSSTVCLNYPLRSLLYLTKEYQAILKQRNQDILSYTQVKIPTPRCIVLYNGPAQRPEREVMKLSDAFANQDVEGCLELKVEILNINYGKNESLQKACKTLEDYAILVAKIREYAREMDDLSMAVHKAIQYCIDHDHLRDFLILNQAEVAAMSLLEGSWEEYADSMDQELERLKKEAALGREYRKELEGRFVKAAMLLELGLKEPVLREMAAALEAAQLKQAGCALEKKTAKLYPPQTQLSSVKETALKTDSAFLI